MKNNIKKVTIAGMLVALTVALSSFSIPIGASKCYPVQHLMNIIAGIFLGPVYGVGTAFCSSLIRNLMGTGSLLAFPGSMVGALLCGLLYRKFGRLTPAYAGEVVGTGIIGAMLCYPVATLIMGKEAAVFTYVLPFLLSTLSGTVIAILLVGAMKRSGILEVLKGMLESRA